MVAKQWPTMISMHLIIIVVSELMASPFCRYTIIGVVMVCRSLVVQWFARQLSAVMSGSSEVFVSSLIDLGFLKGYSQTLES